MQIAPEKLPRRWLEEALKGLSQRTNILRRKLAKAV
jgi:hypothetical protein